MILKIQILGFAYLYISILKLQQWKTKANLCEQLYSSCKVSGQIMSRSFGGHVEVHVGELQNIIIINSL